MEFWCLERKFEGTFLHLLENIFLIFPLDLAVGLAVYVAAKLATNIFLKRMAKYILEFDFWLLYTTVQMYGHIDIVQEKKSAKLLSVR